MPVEFRITTYWKRGRNETGLTHMASKRLVASQVLDWVLDELPAAAVQVDSAPDRVTVHIDWSRVPDEIRYGRRS